MLIFVLNCFKGYSQDTIYWKSCYKLKWEDFLGKPDTISSFEAITSSGIDYKYFYSDTSFSFTVKSFFDKKNSWKASSANLSTLKHEQLHFDITEIFARKLKNHLSKLKPIRTTVKKEVSDLVRKILEEKEDMQNQYDKETDFGRNSVSQKKWQTKITSLLQQSK